ncbi:VOC family protein [Flammeovirgaceae bacterium SG7u.111]|nr:VOC family protein [Flammeovirgaceae bacterium SG7u.132]WPO34150.1 VOC family protein [Flammeovirgaceae bacterium SG7u.111]
MNQSLVNIALVVDDYDKAIQFYTETLGFELVEDSDLGEGKRWVLVRPKGEGSCRILLAKASGEKQEKSIGNQTGGRVFLFLHTDDFWQDYHAYTSKGVKFVREPAEEAYGIVSVFEDCYGNLWDLIEPKG